MSIRQRLYPTPEQAPLLVRHCADSRYVWNVALEQANWYDPEGARRGRPSPGHLERSHQLALARQAFPWLAEGASSVQQAALRDFDRALQNWWKGTHRRPQWRKAGVNEGFVVHDLRLLRLNRRFATVRVPKVGYVRFRLTRPWADTTAVTSARVTVDRSGRWWVSLVCPPPKFERQRTETSVGIDRGVANSVALDSGVMLAAPTLTVPEQRRYVALQRRMARQMKGSARREATRIQIARLHARQNDRRINWVDQTTTDLVRRFDVIAIEDLSTANMTRRPKPKPNPEQPGDYLTNGARAKAALNRAILASCWGRLERRLDDKTAATIHLEPQHRSVLVRVDPRNTSRMCATCGHTARENRESQAVFSCQACGHVAHADTNAACNIIARGVESLSGRACRDQTYQSGPASSVNHPKGNLSLSGLGGCQGGTPQ